VSVAQRSRPLTRSMGKSMDWSMKDNIAWP